MFSWKRAAQLARSVALWYPSPDHPNREVGWVRHAHPFARPTIQIAVRSAKAKGGWSYHVIVSRSSNRDRLLAPPETASARLLCHRCLR
jgi:hypothetical protein